MFSFPPLSVILLDENVQICHLASRQPSWNCPKNSKVYQGDYNPCIAKRKSQECQNRELGQPKVCETKMQLQSKSLWELIIFHCLYYYSGFIQTPTVENHSQNTPWPSKNPRENKESICLTKIITAGHVPLCVGKCLHSSSLVMVSIMCFKVLSIFYLTGMFQVPAVHWWTWRQGPWLLTCWQGAVWLQDYLISLLRDSKKQYKP